MTRVRQNRSLGGQAQPRSSRSAAGGLNTKSLVYGLVVPGRVTVAPQQPIVIINNNITNRPTTPRTTPPTPPLTEQPVAELQVTPTPSRTSGSVGTREERTSRLASFTATVAQDGVAVPPEDLTFAWDWNPGTSSRTSRDPHGRSSSPGSEPAQDPSRSRWRRRTAARQAGPPSTSTSTESRTISGTRPSLLEQRSSGWARTSGCCSTSEPRRWRRPIREVRESSVTPS